MSVRWLVFASAAFACACVLKRPDETTPRADAGVQTRVVDGGAADAGAADAGIANPIDGGELDAGFIEEADAGVGPSCGARVCAASECCDASNNCVSLGWRTLMELEGPPPRLTPAVAWDVARSRFVVFGGQTQDGQWLGDTWTLSLDPTPRWTRLSNVGAPTARGAAAAAFDPTRERFLLYGGRAGPLRSPEVTGELWALEADGAWTLLRPSSAAAPSARAFSSLAFDATGDRILVVGGNIGASSVADAWAYELARGTWREYAEAGSLGRRFGHATAFDAPRGELLIVGGDTAEPAQPARPSNDVIALEVATGRWRSVAPPCSASPSCPAPRRFFAAAIDGSGRRLLIHGGLLADGRASAETWSLTLDGAATWTRLRTSPASDTRRYHHAGAFDPASRTFVITGGGEPTEASATAILPLECF